MKKLLIAASLIATAISAVAHERPSWGAWSALTGHAEPARAARAAAPVVPAGTATYNGATLAYVTDSSSGSAVKSVSTGAVSVNVAFDGAGNTTQAGTITGLTGAGGAAVGDLSFTGSGKGREFHGLVTSTTYPAVAATATSRATGVGSIAGVFSAPVVDKTTSAVSAPQTLTGAWNFNATSTLKATGAFASAR